MPTIVGILTFIRRINTGSGDLNLEFQFKLDISVFTYKLLKFHAHENIFIIQDLVKNHINRFSLDAAHLESDCIICRVLFLFILYFFFVSVAVIQIVFLVANCDLMLS